MFSTMRDAILERTNRSREEQQRRNDDKNEFVVVDRPAAEEARGGSNAEDPTPTVRNEDDGDADDSRGSESSVSAGSTTPSRTDASHTRWRFMQCDTTIHASSSCVTQFDYVCEVLC